MPQDYVQPAWHALCGVVILVGGLQEVDRSLGGTRAESRAERRARCMPRLPERLRPDFSTAAGDDSPADQMLDMIVMIVSSDMIVS